MAIIQRSHLSNAPDVQVGCGGPTRTMSHQGQGVGSRDLSRVVAYTANRAKVLDQLRW